MGWTVTIARKVEKALKALPKHVADAAVALAKEIAVAGPYRANKPHYGPLSKTKFHCHLCGGRPTYVACWEITDKNGKKVEVYYVGTHENAPY
jgi:hypothetical protein